MDKLLQTDFISYLDGLKPQIIKCSPVKIKDIRTDVIDDVKFDIKDKESTIKQPIGKGSVTYNNPQKKIIAIIDYEFFLNLQPHQPNCTTADDVIKRLELKEPDFIVYDLDNKAFFILNELSFGNLNNKRKDAYKQLHNAILHFDKVPSIKAFIDSFEKKICMFSCKTQTIKVPDGSNADALLEDNLSQIEEEPARYQPITKLGFTLIEKAIIDI
jgi:hypothetical protein